MPIRFRCPQCQQRLSIGSHKTGTLIECPTCKEQVRVPEDSELSSLRVTVTPETLASKSIELEKHVEVLAPKMEVASSAAAASDARREFHAPSPVHGPQPAWMPK